MARRLAAIVFTDIAGYTALSHRDEPAALRLLQDQERLVRGLLEVHQGRLVKSIGDGLLLEHSNALDAVACAIDLQRHIQERNARQPAPELRVRIGIHLGDVQEAGPDILGDAVNIASRLEPLAEPGGICLSAQVYDQVHNKIAVRLEKMGSQNLKGVREPVVVYRAILPGTGDEATPRAPPRRRLAVLPLTNMSPDPSDEYFADGMTEELISTVSKVPELSVISRTSVMQYKSKTKPMAEIGHELGAGTILEGSVRKAGNRVRVAVQMIDAAGDRHLWAEKYDRSLDDVFAIQSEIAQKVASALEIHLLAEDERKLQKVPTSDSEAHLLHLRGLFDFNRGTEEGMRAAISLWEEATRHDSNYATAYAWLSRGYSMLGFFGWAPASEASAQAKRFAEKALALDESLVQAHLALAGVLLNEWDFEASTRETERAVELSPNDPYARCRLAADLSCRRRFKEAWEQLQLAVKLAPNDLQVLEECATWYLYAGRPERAASLYEQIIARNPTKLFSENNLGLAHIQMGQIKRGLAEIEASIRHGTTYDNGKQSDLAYALALDGQATRARQVISAMERYHDEHGTGAGWVAVAWGGVGDREKALEWLERAYEERDPTMPVFMGSDFTLDFLRSDPRFEALARKMGHPMARSDPRA